MTIADLIGAVIAVIVVSLLTIKLYDLYKYIDEFEESVNEDSE